MNIVSIFSPPTLGFLLTVVFGFWVSEIGRPYNGLLFNIHKLIALGTVIIVAIRVNEALKNSQSQGLVVGLIVVAALAVMALFVSGAFLSIGNVKYEVVKLIHNVAPVIAVLAMGGVIYLLSGRVP